MTGPEKTIIASVIAFCVLGLLLLGYRTTNEFTRDFAANLLADAAVAGGAFILADLVFGLRQRRQQQMEAQRTAYGLVGMEMEENEKELERIVQVLRDGKLTHHDAVFRRDRTFQTENWRLLVQSPLVAHLPVEFVWALQESYVVSQKHAETLRHRTDDVLAANWDWWRELNAEFLPKFEQALKLTGEAIEVLRKAYVER